MPTRLLWTLGSAALAAVLALVCVPEPAQARTVALCAVCLVLWLSEAVPGFVPTLILIGLAPLLLPFPGAALPALLHSAADPVLALFFGGFALGLAGERHGIAAAIAARVVRWSGGSARGLLIGAMAATAVLSMWMSNIAAAALMLAALRPITHGLPEGDRRRTALLLGVAFAANLGGMATPMGSGPNALALARLDSAVPGGFGVLGWMLAALPLVLLLLLAVAGLLIAVHRVRGRFGDTPGPPYRTTRAARDDAPAVARDFDVDAPAADAAGREPTRQRPVVLALLFAVIVLGFLSAPWHQQSPATIALLGAAALFASGLLTPRDLRALDWGTLLLIAGGLIFGAVIEHSGLLSPTASVLGGAGDGTVRLALLAGLAALLSAVMSNTATAALLLPIAAAIAPGPAALLAVALGCSLGCPFAISTPPNAMAVGAGVPARSLLAPGLLIAALGLVLLSLGAPLLAWLSAHR